MNINVHSSPEEAHRVLNDALINMGMCATGTVLDHGDYYAIMNDWESRDAMARVWNAYDRRFSMAGKVHGRWYCFKKNP